MISHLKIVTFTLLIIFSYAFNCPCSVSIHDNVPNYRRTIEWYSTSMRFVDEEVVDVDVDDIVNFPRQFENLRGNDKIPPLTLTPPRDIFLLIEPSPFTHVSGYSNRFNEQLKYLSQARDNVKMLTVDSNNSSCYSMPSEKFGYTIEQTRGFVFPFYRDIRLTIDFPDMKGIQMLLRWRPDIIHVSSPGFLCLTALFYARILRIPLLMSYHTSLPGIAKIYLPRWPLFESILWGYLKWIHSRADLTLVTSPQLHSELLSKGFPRVDVWRKGIDTKKFHPKFKCETTRDFMTNGHPEDFLLLYVGRLGVEKRLKDIKSILKKLGPTTRLCIVGVGPQEEQLRSYFNGTNTVFTGALHGEVLSRHYASADVFVMPSDSETLGFVVLESMASGVPVVGAAAGGIPDLIHNHINGYLVPPRDIPAFVRKINLLKDDKHMRDIMGTNARKETERWNWESATSILRNIQYEKAINNFQSRAFGGFGGPGTKALWKLWKFRMCSTFRRIWLLK